MILAISGESWGVSLVALCYLCANLFHVTSAERFIVELTETTSVLNITRNLPESPPQCLLEAVLSIGTVFDNGHVFKGFSIFIESNENSQKRCLESLDGVAHVWSSQTYKLASSTNPVFEHPDPAGGQGKLHTTTTQKKFNSSAFHELTGVNELHSRGITGRGVVVAVLDTGIDYLHPGLGGGFGPEYRVRFGYDFVGDDYLNGDEPTESPDPYSECHYHGTHVSGIIGGDHPEVGLAGAAPDVMLEMYRCTGCTNQPINSEVVIKAAIMAHERGVDVISASLILEEGAYSDDPVTEVLSRIAEQDRMVVVLAAGNWGWAGTFSAAAPAAARGILVVGAVNGEHIHKYAARARAEVRSDCPSSSSSCTVQGGQVEEFAWFPAPPSRFPDSLLLHAVTLNISVEDDSCSSSSLPWPSPDLHGVIVLVRRGGCSFADKMETIKAAGADYALIYDNTPDTDDEGAWSLVDADNVFDMGGVGFVSASTGERLIDLLRSGREVAMRMDSNFTMTPYISDPVPNTFPPGQIAPRGTWGPDGEMGLIPSILAPGIGILSTFPRSWGGHKKLSGTSMSAPYVAGCAALVRQAHPNIKASEIVRRLMSTSRPLKFHDGADEGGEYDFLAPTYKQGAGLLDCLAAVITTTEVGSSHLALGDAEFFKAEQKLHLINAGQSDALYRVSHVPAASVDSLSKDRGRIVPMTLGYTDVVASEEFLETLRPKQHVGLRIDPSPTEVIRLPPGTETSIHLAFEISGFSSERCPLYGGFVDIQQIEGAEKDGHNEDDRHHTLAHLSVPYAGVACRLRDVPVLQPQLVNPVNYTFLTAATLRDPLGGPYAAEPIRPYHVFTIPGPEQHARCALGGQCAENNNSLDEVQCPTISLSLAFQTRAVSFDLVRLAPVAPTNRLRGAATSDHHLGQGRPAFAAVATTEHPGGFSRVWTKYFAFRGQLTDGSWAPAGDYVFRVCGVRAWDDPRDPRAFGDCVTTDPFVLRYTGVEGDGGGLAIGTSDGAQASLFDLGHLYVYYDTVIAALEALLVLTLVACLFAWLGRKGRQPWHEMSTGTGEGNMDDDRME